MVTAWLSDNYIEVFGAIAGVIFVILEIRQHIWLWPVGIITSGVYVWVFFNGKLYADMSLQMYYLVISIFGWYWWLRGTPSYREGERNSREEEKETLPVTRLKFRTGAVLSMAFIMIYSVIWYILVYYTDSPVPIWDSFITALSIVATWMLARKIYEHWYLWIIVNTVSALLFFNRGLYPTLLLYIVYGLMSFYGLLVWKRTIKDV